MKTKKRSVPVFKQKKTDTHTKEELLFYKVYGMYPKTEEMLEQFLKTRNVQKGFGYPHHD